MEKPFGFSDAVASGSIKRIGSFFLYTALVHHRGHGGHGSV